ncbi:MAG: hydantoinase B/oxoprolinase family protein, partial [Rhodobacteraceae bacterium]|nr:hydantoinase B/oxoprolinase family protein [Paracoccaceae bacterium]
MSIKTETSDGKWQFWVDRGGTFTDIVAKAPDGSLKNSKYLSENPEQYKDAAIQGIRDFLKIDNNEKIQGSDVDCVKMGTTVATNALLERKGDRTLLLITEGFRDLLRIGYQARPKLFDFNIILPTPIYEIVGEIKERLDAEGEIIEPLNLSKARETLKSARVKGIKSVAIALMHSYLNPIHEKRIAQIAADEGFEQISISHEISPLMKLVGRADTTVIDAYLSPILRRYVAQISSEFDSDYAAQLLFMQSNGGLTGANVFRGKDAILSGPAGGVVGMVKTAQIAGFEKLIGFDMGGTSTDVCHYNGEFERSFETEVAGARVRAPMMDIHTVAAGGGSILFFRDGRFQVGPDSAGANPGPACYRRGGPLTVTDCNVMLGKLQPSHFPRVFGPNADQPIDVSVVENKFMEFAEEISVKTGDKPLSAVELADGFLRIAVSNMANAIKKISVQRGYDVTKYALQCFGGAGGQHACLVADALGIETIFIHPFAGVLSAYGMGLAEIRCMRESQFERSLSDYEDALELLTELSGKATDQVASQGVNNENVIVECRAHLRLKGSHQALMVNFGNLEELKLRFDEAHFARYGFSSDGRELVFEALSVEAIGGASVIREEVHKEVKQKAVAVDRVTVTSHGELIKTPLYERSLLKPGQQILGPAIIKEPTGTNFIEPGWSAKVNKFSHLILERQVPVNRREAIGTKADPIMLEVFNSLFMSIAEQMGATLANTAYSVNIKERLDFSCALFDSKGGLVANAPHVPVHLGSMSGSIKSIIRQNPNMKQGEVFVLNAPFNGGTHLPDVTVITPVFDDGGAVLFFVASRGHHADIGGKTPGSAPPDSQTIEEEGVLIDNFKLVENGNFKKQEVRKLLSSGKYPCRNVEENLADLAAQVAANETGVREVRKMIEQFGVQVVHSYMRYVQDNAEECVRQVLVRLKGGKSEYELDNGEFIRVSVSVDNEARTAEIDFTGTASKDPLNYNAPLAVCHAVVLYVFRSLIGAEIPLNEGCFRPLTIIAPKGSMIHAEYPSAVIAGNTEVSQLMCNALLQAMGIMA